MMKAYDRALGQLRRLPKGDPRRNRAILKVRYWQRAIEKYQRNRNN